MPIYHYDPHPNVHYAMAFDIQTSVRHGIEFK
jgi:hypothetical protein